MRLRPSVQASKEFMGCALSLKRAQPKLFCRSRDGRAEPSSPNGEADLTSDFLTSDLCLQIRVIRVNPRPVLFRRLD
jgi:hypothetical protein